MKLISLYVRSFGKLKDVTLNFNEDKTLVLQDNGFGKTTLCAFIKAMFYGFTYKIAAAGEQKDALVYAPWDSSQNYGGTLDFESDGKLLRIERYFNGKPSGEKTTLYDVATGKQLPCDNIGERYLGISAAAYERCFYLPQKDVEIVGDESLEKKLTNMAEEADTAKAVAILEEYALNINGRRQQAVIPVLLSKKRMETERLRGFQRAEDEITEDTEKIERLDEKLADCSQKLVETEKLYQTASQRACRRVSPEVEAQAKADYAQAKLNTENVKFEATEREVAAVQTLAPYVRVKKISLPFVIAALLLAVAAVVLFVCLQFAFGGVACAFAVALLVLGLTRTQSVENDKLKEILAKYIPVEGFDILAAKEEFLKRDKADCEARLRLSSAKAKLDLLEDAKCDKAADAELNKLKADKENLTQALNALTAQKGALQGEIGQLKKHGDIAECLDTLQRCDDEISKAQRLFACAEKAKELIERAKEQVATAYVPKLSTLASDYFKTLTSTDATLSANTDFHLFLTADGVRKDASCFSRGTSQQAIFAFRLALSKVLYGDDLPFVIVDDGFVDYDEARFAKAMEFLKSFSGKSQVIYFTCHQRGEKLLR